VTVPIFFLNYFQEAAPKRILEVMKDPGLTREQVASHLQVRFFLPTINLAFVT